MTPSDIIQMISMQGSTTHHYCVNTWKIRSDKSRSMSLKSLAKRYVVSSLSQNGPFTDRWSTVVNMAWLLLVVRSTSTHRYMLINICISTQICQASTVRYVLFIRLCLAGKKDVPIIVWIVRSKEFKECWCSFRAMVRHFF